MQDILDKDSEEQKRAADAYPAAQQVTRGRANDDDKRAEETRFLAPLIVSSSNRIVVTAPPTGDGAAFCLVTPPIAPGSDKSEVAVASVRFTLQSHDQGWTTGTPGTFSSQPSKQPADDPLGIYEDSHTWFQAAIIRNSDPDVATMLLSMGTMTNDTLNRRTNDRDVWYSDSWNIQHNICASSETRTHVVTWSRSSTISDEEAKERGCGTGGGFLLALVPGDRTELP